MKRLPSLAAAVGTIALTGTMSFAVASGGGPSTTATTPSPTPEPSATAAAQARTLTPADFKTGDVTGDEVIPVPSPAWDPPTGYTGSLKPDDWVQISGTGSCLNVRVAPALVFDYPEGDQPVPTLNCLPDGFTGQLSLGPFLKDGGPPPMPVQADGYWWWHLLGQGWVAEDWLVATEAPAGPSPELADAGLIAFMRADGVWLMNADGSEPRRLYAADTLTSTISSIDWSPDGSSLVISMNTWNEMTTRYLTVLVALDGTVIGEHAGLSEATWSPDGGRLAGLRFAADDVMFGMATPVVVDLASGSEIPVGPKAWYGRGPEWAPDGASLAFFCRSGKSEWQSEQGVIESREAVCDGDGLRTVSVDGTGVSVIFPFDAGGIFWSEGVSWSPDSARIATYSNGGDCRGYAIIDVATASRTTCLPVPEETNFGGCGIGIELGASDWTPDGRTLAYHWQFGSGQNGVALVDVASGERRMIPTTGASSISFSPDGLHLSYESAGYVWTAAADGSNVTRVTDGWLPMWQPAR